MQVTDVGLTRSSLRRTRSLQPVKCFVFKNIFLIIFYYSVGPATKRWKQPGRRCAPPGRPRPRPRPYTTAQAESPHSTHRTHNTHTARTLADAQFPFGTSPALQLMLSSNARGDGNLPTMQSPATKNQGFLRYTVRGYSLANLAELFAAAASRRTSPFS